MKYIFFVLIFCIIFQTGCSYNAYNMNEKYRTANAAQFLFEMQPDSYFFENENIQLAKAISGKDISKMQTALNKGANVNAIGKEDMRPLFWALAKNSIDGFKFLLENGACPNFYIGDYNNHSHINNFSLMEILAGSDKTEYLVLALEYGGDPNFIVESYYPDGRLSSRETIISTAVSKRKVKNIKILYDFGADINFRGFGGDTPLMNAAYIDEYEIVYILLKLGADTEIINNRGRSFWDILDTKKTNRLIDKNNFYYKEIIKLLKSGSIRSEDTDCDTNI